MKKVAVIGLGYVGLPLALQFAKTGKHVYGIDVDRSKIRLLEEGKSYIQHIRPEEIRHAREKGFFEPTHEMEAVGKTEAVVICLPTPLNKNREPDLSYVLDMARQMAPHLQKGVLVVLESTTYPGTTEGPLRECLEQGSGLKAGKDFHLAFSPEREDPGNVNSNLSKVPKVVGGLTPGCLESALALYDGVVAALVPVSSCAAAEATKLLENIFRCVNIALINELKVVYHAMGIDVWEVIEAAKTKPFGFMPFYPGPGLGGHCIPIDPFYLSWKAREYGQNTRFIELAGEINTAMPAWVVGRVIEALNARKRAVNGSRILLMGLAYKADIGDIRESPTFALMDQLGKLGAEIAYYDPHVLEIPATREHGCYTGWKSCAWDAPTIRGFDAVVICTAHAAFNLKELVAWADCIIDTRHAVCGQIRPADGQVWKA